MTELTDDLTAQVPAPIPPHVPSHLVRDFSVFDNDELSKCPYSAVSKLHDGPAIFWTPLSNRGGKVPGGSWVITKAEDIAYVLGQPETFSSKGLTGFSQLIGETWDMVPLESDPPMHAKYRSALAPLVYPKVVKAMSDGIVARAHAMIDDFSDKNYCEFVTSFGRPFPVSIFMQMMGLPSDRMPTFLKWVNDLLHGETIAQRQQAALDIRDYLLQLIADRRDNPQDDIATKIVDAKIDGRPYNHDELLGTFYTFFVGGLDTVASTLGWFFKHLAEHPDQQQYLRDNRSEIPKAVDEMLRRYSLQTSSRQCVKDTVIKGVEIRAGDWITLPYPAGGLDPAKFDNPMEVDFSRKNPRHFAFASGPHFCLGSHLAMRELTAALESWFDRIPLFRIKPGSPVEIDGDVVFGIDKLELEWG